MKRIIMTLLCALLVNVIYAQSDKYKRMGKGVGSAVERAIREYEAAQIRENERIIRQEHEAALRHEQQRREHEVKFERQMNNINNYGANDYLTTPQPTRSPSITTNNLNGSVNIPNISQQRVINDVNDDKRYKIGTPSYSGNNYTGNRYDYKPSGFDNSPNLHQGRIPAEHYRNQYPRRRHNGEGSTVVILHHNSLSEVTTSLPNQQEGSLDVKIDVTQTTGMGKPQQKIVWVENGKIHLNEPFVMTPHSSSSPDLSPVDPFATKNKKIIVNKLPNEASHLSDKDDKITNEHAKMILQKRDSSIRTEADQYKLMREDVANGFNSFENRSKWENIYEYGEAGKIKTPSKIAIQKRK